MRDMVSYTLREAGFAVSEAEDGKKALTALQAAPVDVIITDLNMPNMDGVSLIRALRAHPQFRAVPILMLTTESDAAKKAEGKSAGATGWLVKPFDPKKLVDVVTRHLRTTYFDESTELMESAYAALAALEDGSGDEETMHALFRAIHSIKGGGGAFGFARMVALAHAMETLLDLMRDGTVPTDPARVALVLRGADVLADLLAAERTGVAAPAGMEDELVVAFVAAAETGAAAVA
eukprot:gene12535-16715_t